MDSYSYRTLIIGPAWVGDMVMAQSLFKLLKQRDPHISIDVLAPAWTFSLLACMPEVNAAIERRLRNNHLTAQKAEWLRSEVKKDFVYFFQVLWNENLENKAVELIRRHSLKTLDAVQLASGVLSDAEMFITSDRPLHLVAKKVLRRAHFV